jgi:ATP-dependent DNA helicase RecG
MATRKTKRNSPAHESETVEWKTSLGEWKEIVETVAAFATSSGGTVHVGIDPSGNAIGLQLGKSTIEDLANKIKGNTEPPQFPSIETSGPEGSSRIAVRVEESPIKPVWAFGRPMKRVGRTNQRLSRDEAHRLLESSTGRTWDALPCEGFRQQDVSGAAIRDFLRRADLPRAPIKAALENLKLFSSEGVLCRAAALLFAKNPQRHFIEAQTKCARFLGTDSVEFLDEATFEGTVVNQLGEALTFVRRNTRQAIRITGKPQHERVPEYPEDAVREAITNALCHRDYASVGTVQVRIYDNALEVWNPGQLPAGLTVDDLYQKHSSRPRNPRLAQVLHRAGLIEHWGTGTVRMLEACEGTGVTLEFASEPGTFRVCFRKGAAPTDTAPDQSLSPRQKKALEYARIHGRITNRDYRNLFDIGRVQALKDLEGMRASGALIRRGRGRSTEYVPAAGENEKNE